MTSARRLFSGVCLLAALVCSDLLSAQSIDPSLYSDMRWRLVGPFRGDRAVLGAAHALEQSFAAIPALRRPVPDLSRLEQPMPALKSIVTHPPKPGTSMAASPT